MELNNEESSNVDMLDKIYNARQEDLEEESGKDREILKSTLNEVELEEIEEAIKGLNKNNAINKKEKIIKDIQKLVENYELQIDYYSEKNYKIGFKDAFSLWKQCEKC